MNLKKLIIALPATLLVFGGGVAKAGQTIKEAGALAGVIDKWNESELEKGHKLVDYAGRCVSIPDDPAGPKITCDCAGKYEYLPDGSWTGKGTCTDTYKDGDKIHFTWEEGSLLKESKYTFTGGTGKYRDATGGGTYTLENLTDTLAGGRYKDTIVLP